MWRAIGGREDATIFTVLGEDSKASAGLVVALIGELLAYRLDMPALAAVASIVFGTILIIVVSFLAFGNRDLTISGSS